MPELRPEQRAAGGHTSLDAEPWPDHDWSIPTDAATLRHRVLPVPDQSRYGHATTDPPKYNTAGTPVRRVRS